MYKSLPVRQITAKGCTTAYIDTAPEDTDKPVVICLHGVPASGYMYRNVIDDLGFDARVIAPDIPGFGKSQKVVPWDLSFAEMESWLGNFIEQVVPTDAKINFILHDISGPFGLGWILNHRQRVQSLVLLNTTVFIERFRPPLAAIAGMIPGLGAKLIDNLMHGYVLREGLKREFHGPIDVDTLEHYCTPYKDHAARTALSDVFAQYLHSASYLKDIKLGLERIDFPCTVLFGGKDKYCGPSNAAAFGTHIFGAYVRYLQEVGHFVAEEAPYVVSDEMRKLITTSAPSEQLLQEEPALQRLAS